MQSLNNIRIRIANMAKLALEMWQMTNMAFMKHDLDLFSGVLSKEEKLNNLEKELISELIALDRVSPGKKDKIKGLIFTEIVGDLELIGDYCKDILERVEIKIEEKLLFSDDAVKEYEEVYHKTEADLIKIVSVLESGNLKPAKEVLKNKKRIGRLVEEYRARHSQRLMDGVCSPIACNMFLNILDFTAAIYDHAIRIAENLLKAK